MCALTPVQGQGQDAGPWAPATWADVLQPVAEFLRVTADTFRGSQLQERAAARSALLQALADAADAFEPDGRSPSKSVGYKRVMTIVRDLQR